SWFVAAITRTSRWIVSTEPTRLMVRSSRARRSLGCISSGRSPTSSRKMVPPRATSKAPGRAWCAPVKAPFWCPKSSDSISVGGIVLQSITTSGPPGGGAGSRAGPARAEPLAGAALPREEDGRLDRGDAGQDREQAAHRQALAHRPPETLL